MTHPRVVAAFCYRYEPDEMVADACESLSWCDDVVTLCDRGHPEVWSPRAACPTPHPLSSVLTPG